MSKTLHITNGDCAVDVMKAAGTSGDFLPWRDVLHIGPVPDLPLEELSKIRAEYISRQKWGEKEQVERSFIERDNTLKNYAEYERVILWFEHDLYDQLQILQILHWFSLQEKIQSKLSIICTDSYLGQTIPEELKELQKHEESITPEHLNIANRAWSAFTSDTPTTWHSLLGEDTSILPFLHNAILRMLEEYPNSEDGLSRTERQIVTIINEGETHPEKIFGKNQKLEEAVFMGDTIFFNILEGLQQTTPSLLSISDENLKLTNGGIEVIEKKRNLLKTNRYDFWIGGVHLANENLWCFDAKNKTIYN